MSPLHLIIFLFIGHSNMNGHCASMDVLPAPHVWIYKNGEFKNGTDKDYGGDNNQSGSVVMPFLKRMALMYPDYNFAGIKMASSCAQAFHRHPGEARYDFFVKQIRELQAKGATIGGVLMMYGFIEGQFKESVDSLSPKISQLIENIRGDVGNKKLPVLLGRYEEYADGHDIPQYHKWDHEVISQINSMPALVENLALCPRQPIPREYYCDNHHYDSQGYQVWANDAVSIIMYSGFDFWNKNK